MKTKPIKLLTTLALTACVSSAIADVVVNFNGLDGTLLTSSVNWGTSANTVFATTTLTDDTVRSTVAYGTTLATNGSGTYTGPTIVGGAYINAVYTATQTATEGTWGSVANVTTPPDVLRIRRNGSNTGIDATQTITRWAYTFNVNAGGPYEVTAGSSLNLTGGIGGHTADEGRWLLVDSGTLYVSQSAINYESASTTNYSLSNLHSENWAAWTPGSDLSLGSLTYNVAGASFENIQRAGFYGTKTGSTGQNVDIRVFTADLTAIPEPGTLALVGVALGSLLLFRRKG